MSKKRYGDGKCQDCKYMFQVMIDSPRYGNLCFKCYRERFGNEQLGHALSEMESLDTLRGWNSIDGKIFLDSDLIDRSYMIFQQEQLQTDPFKPPKHDLEDADKIEATNLLISIEKADEEDLTKLKKLLEEDEESLRKIDEIVHARCHVILMKTYGRCTLCNQRSLNKQQKSKYLNKMICHVCRSKEIADELNNKPRMNQVEYEEFFSKNADQMPSRNKELVNDLVWNEHSMNSDTSLVENYVRQNIHVLEKHPTDQRGWCNYCEMWVRKTPIPKKIRDVLESCPECFEIVKNIDHENEEIPHIIKPHIKISHKEIYKTIMEEDSVFYQWAFITPEEDERRIFLKWKSKNPSSDQYDEEQRHKERNVYVKKHYPFSKNPVSPEDPNSIFPSLHNYNVVNEDGSNPSDLPAYRSARFETSFVEDFAEGSSKEINNYTIPKLKTNFKRYADGKAEGVIFNYVKAYTFSIINDYKEKFDKDAYCKFLDELNNKLLEHDKKNDLEDYLNELRTQTKKWKKESRRSKLVAKISNQIWDVVKKDIAKNKDTVKFTKKGVRVSEKLLHNVISNYNLSTTEKARVIDLTQRIIKDAMSRSVRALAEKKLLEESEKPTKPITNDKKKRKVLLTKHDPIVQKAIKKDKVKPVEKLNFDDFKDLLREKEILGKLDFENYLKAEVNPSVPKSPETFYKKQGWKGWRKATGFKPKKPALTQEEIDNIKNEIRDNWDLYTNLEEGAIIWFFDQWGVFGIKDPIQRALFNEFVKWKDIPKKQNAIWDYLNIGDSNIIKERIITSPDKVVETREEFLSRQFSSTVKEIPLFETETKTIEEIIRRSDHYIPTIKNDKLNRFMRLKFMKNLWISKFDNPKQDVDNLQRNGLEFHDKVISDFKSQYHTVTDDYAQIWRQYVKFYKFNKGKPTLMQRYGAFMLLTIQGLLNMFGTGTGKTLTAILASKVINAKHVFWICPKNTIDQTRNMIIDAFPDVSEVTTVLDNAHDKSIPQEFFDNPAMDGHVNKKNGKYITKYHIINYDRFSTQRNSDTLLEQLLGKKIELFVLDESQMVKNRNESEAKASNRRKKIIDLLNDLRHQNPNMRVLMLSATPIVNNVAEFQSLYKMLSGTDLRKHGMSTYTNIKNSARMFVESQPFSIRYEAKYDIEVFQPIIECEGHLPDEMSDETARSMKFLELESFLTEVRIPYMLEKIREIKEKNPDEKIVVYTHFVGNGIVDKLQVAFRNAGYRVGEFTGNEKSGWVKQVGTDSDGKPIYEYPFKERKIDILIASRTFQVGVDGAQDVCKHIFFNGFVWTDTEFEQTKGRLLRGGQASKEVYVHMFFATINGFKYDHEVKYLRVLRKRAVGDLCKDGRLPKDIALGEEKEKENAIEKMLENRKTGFPTKEKLDQMHALEAERQVTTELEELKKQFPNANFDREDKSNE